MATFDKKYGIVLSEDDKESLNGSNKIDVSNIINWVVWGKNDYWKKEKIYDKNN